MGRMTASLRDSFAASRPATSSHLTFGVSVTIAPDANVGGQLALSNLERNRVRALVSPARNFFSSASSPPSSPVPFVLPPTPLVAAPLEPIALLDRASSDLARYSLSFSARPRYSAILLRIVILSRSFFSSGNHIENQTQECRRGARKHTFECHHEVF